MQGGMRLEIEPAAFESIASTIRACDPRLETGGALLGPPDGSRVLHAVKPGPLAVHGHRLFQRDLDYTQQEAERLYQSDGSQWIGEWHTHVDVPATPSAVDLATYVKHLNDSALGFERFVALVISTSGPQAILAAWILERRGDGIAVELAGTHHFDLKI